jgi:hypothetical protein
MFRAHTKWFRYNAYNKWNHDRCSVFSDFSVCISYNTGDNIHDLTSVDWYEAIAAIAWDNIMFS